MYNSKLTSLYLKSNIFYNFINSNSKWLLSSSKGIDTTIVSLNCTPKKYNKKTFVISLLMMEYILKGPFLNIQRKKYNFVFLKSFVSKKKINIQYVLNNANAFMFIDNFITDMYWMILEENPKFTNTVKLDMNKLATITYTVEKLLDFTSFIKNKIRLERYLLRKLYSFNIIFPVGNYLWYLWWIRTLGFYKFI